MVLSRAYFGHPPADFVHHLLVITPDPLLNFVIPVRAKPHDRILARTHDKKRHHLADPESWETIPPMEGKCDAEGQCEYVVSYEVERRAEMLSSLSSQHATAGTGQAVCDLERGDEGHHLTDEVYDRFFVAEEIPVYVFSKQERDHDDCSCYYTQQR